MNFILYDVTYERYSDLIIWQLGMIGNLSPVFKNKNPEGLKLVQEKLLKSYPANHEIYLYEASLYPGIKSRIRSFNLITLIEQEITSISTLYIPGLKGKKVNKEMIIRLKLNLEDLQY